jgi:hypothetical protein
MSEDLRDKRSTPANNVTPYHSLRSADKETLTPEAVADNAVKPSLGDRAENPCNCNVEDTRSMGESKNEP